MAATFKVGDKVYLSDKAPAWLRRSVQARVRTIMSVKSSPDGHVRYALGHNGKGFIFPLLRASQLRAEKLGHRVAKPKRKYVRKAEVSEMAKSQLGPMKNCEKYLNLCERRSQRGSWIKLMAHPANGWDYARQQAAIAMSEAFVKDEEALQMSLGYTALGYWIDRALTAVNRMEANSNGTNS